MIHHRRPFGCHFRRELVALNLEKSGVWAHNAGKNVSGCKEGLMRAGTMWMLTVLAAASPVAAADSPVRPVTFSKDVAPIFQAKCQECHQPNSIAPMSLITYQEARPWARSIKQRVASRQMPPWHIDKSVGVQKFKNDISLTDQQVDTI